jgi:hypothetical protein
VAPKSAPLIVTAAPTAPDVGVSVVMLGGGVTVKPAPLLGNPPTVTTTGPVVARAGTVTKMLVGLHAVGVAAVPLNVTVLAPCVAPKSVPAIVMAAPIAAAAGERLVMFGGTVKPAPLLACPPTVTTTLPLDAPAGTGTVMLVAPHAVGVAVVPLNRTVLVPCVAPKFTPPIVTGVPAAPDAGESEVMLGGTVKVTPLLGSPLTVTTTGPVAAPAGTGTRMLAALQLVGTAAVPLKVTVLVPCVAPK